MTYLVVVSCISTSTTFFLIFALGMHIQARQKRRSAKGATGWRAKRSN